MGKHGNGIGSGYSTLSYHLLDDEQVVFSCPFGLNGNGGFGLYNIDANVGNTTGAVIIAFRVFNVPDRAIWTYDGQSASEYSSPYYGYLQDMIGTIGRDCGFNNANGSGNTTFTNANNYYYDADSQQFELVDDTPVSLNGGNPYSAAQVNLTPSAPGWAIMVVPKPNSTPSLLNVVAEGPCSTTGWDIKIECPRPLQARPASQVNCNGIKMDSNVEIKASLNQLQFSSSTATTELGISVGTYVFGEFIPDGTTVASIQSGNFVTLSASATQSGTGNKITFSDDILYFADVSQLDGNTVGSDNQSDFNVKVHDWVYADSSAVNSITGTWYISKNQYTDLDLVKLVYANDVVTSLDVCDPPCTLSENCTVTHTVVGDKIRFIVMCGSTNVTPSVGLVKITVQGSETSILSSAGPHSGTHIEFDKPDDNNYTFTASDAVDACKYLLTYNFTLGTGGCTIAYAGNYNPNATFSLNSTCICPTWTPTVAINSNATSLNGNGSSFTVTWNMPTGWVNNDGTPKEFNYFVYNAATNTPVSGGLIPSDSSNIASRTFTNFEPGSYFVQTLIFGLGGEEDCISNNTSFTINLSSPVSGCTDPVADNYNSNATVDDGSCTYCANFAAVLLSQIHTTSGQCNGQLTATGSGGSNNYSMVVTDLNGIPQNPVALCAGDYVITVTDVTNGCTDSLTKTIN